MLKLRAHFAITLGLLALLSAPALADWNHRVDSNLAAEGGKHPKDLTQALVVPFSSEGPQWLCVGYANDFTKDVGRIKSIFDLSRTEAETGEVTFETFTRRGSLENNGFLRCKEIEALSKGDLIVAHHRFSGFPRFRDGAINVVTFLGPARLPYPHMMPDIPATAQWNHRFDSEYSSEESKHPKQLNHTFVAPSDLPGPNLLCTGYGRDFERPDEGQIKSVFNIAGTDPETGEAVSQRRVRRGGVEDDNFIGCKEIGTLAAGDTIVAEHAFTGFPKLRDGTINIVTFVGPEKLPVEALLAPPVPEPTPEPPPPAPAPDPAPDPKPDPGPAPGPNPGGAKDYSYVSIPLNILENVAAADWDKKLAEVGILNSKQRRAWNRKQGTVFRLKLTRQFAASVRWKLGEIAYHFAFDEMTAAGDVFYLERPTFMNNQEFAEYIRFMADAIKGGAWRSFGKTSDLQVWSNHPHAKTVTLSLKYRGNVQKLPAVDQIITLNVPWFSGKL